MDLTLDCNCFLDSYSKTAFAGNIGTHLIFKSLVMDSYTLGVHGLVLKIGEKKKTPSNFRGPKKTIHAAFIFTRSNYNNMMKHW